MMNRRICVAVIIMISFVSGLTAQVSADTLTGYIKGLELQNEQLNKRIADQDKMIQELITSNEKLYESLNEQLEQQTNGTDSGISSSDLAARNQMLEEKIAEQEKAIQELTASNEQLYNSLADQLNIKDKDEKVSISISEADSSDRISLEQIETKNLEIDELKSSLTDLEKKLADQEQIIEVLTIDNTNLREEITLMLSQKPQTSPTIANSSQITKQDQVSVGPSLPQANATKTHTIQFFKSRYPDKIFSELQMIGRVVSYQEGSLTSYQLLVDDPSKLSLVHSAGFRDAYIVD